jgi:exo-beta-1,3-glucanase (GH17 family)
VQADGAPGLVPAVVLGALLLAIGDGQPASRPRCPGGTFLLGVEEQALVPGGAVPDAIVLARTRVSVASGCTSRRVKRSRRGTRVAARWARCGTTLRHVVLKATVSPECTSLTGALRAWGGRYRRTFAAQRVAAATTTTTPSQPTTTTTLAPRLRGVAFGPYAGEQDPNLGAVVTREQVRERLTGLRSYTRAVRTYGSRAGLEHVGPVARELGMRVVPGAWIGRDAAENDRQLERLIDALRAGPVDAGIVGNEALLRGDVTAATLAAYVERVRAAVPGVPIGTADTAAELLDHPELVPHLDALFVHIHPFWDGVQVDEAIARVAATYRRVAAIAAGRPVVIGETGWPTCGEPVGEAVPSPEHAARYLTAFLDWADRTGVAYFWFEGSDEPWKARYEGARGACWGLTDTAGVLKPAFRPVLDGAAR